MTVYAKTNNNMSAKMFLTVSPDGPSLQIWSGLLVACPRYTLRAQDETRQDESKRSAAVQRAESAALSQPGELSAGASSKPRGLGEGS